MPRPMFWTKLPIFFFFLVLSWAESDTALAKLVGSAELVSMGVLARTPRLTRCCRRTSHLGLARCVHPSPLAYLRTASCRVDSCRHRVLARQSQRRRKVGKKNILMAILIGATMILRVTEREHKPPDSFFFNGTISNDAHHTHAHMCV